MQVGSLSGSDGSCSDLIVFHKKENPIGVKASVSVGYNSECFHWMVIIVFMKQFFKIIKIL